MTKPGGKKTKKAPAGASTAPVQACPSPPADIQTRKLEIREVHPSTLLRIAWDNPGHPLLNFRATRANRFDAPDSSYGTLYAAGSLDVCFAETLLRGDVKNQPLVGGNTFIPETELQKRTVVTLDGSEPLRLAVLAGAPLKRLGGDASVTSVAPYDVPQQWSKAIHAHPEKVDGFIYKSRHLNDKEAVVLFDRAVIKLKATKGPALLAHPEIGGIFDLFELAI